jgi:predicted regulator of Ras-like GTPase activity (Roadblock/LC7/MglB family)
MKLLSDEMRHIIEHLQRGARGLIIIREDGHVREAVLAEEADSERARSESLVA